MYVRIRHTSLDRNTQFLAISHQRTTSTQSSLNDTRRSRFTRYMAEVAVVADKGTRPLEGWREIFSRPPVARSRATRPRAGALGAGRLSVRAGTDLSVRVCARTSHGSDF